MDDTCIIYVHGNAWGGVPARQRYLMEEMARRVPVIYLEETEARKYRVTHEHPAEGVTVVRGLMPMWIRFGRRGWTRLQKLWSHWHLGWVRRKYRRIILWDAESWLRAYRFIPHDVYVYDCIDPCFSDDPAEAAAFRDREEEVIRRADLVFASADRLAEHCRRLNPNVALLNNACAPQEYEPRLLAAAARPAWWPDTTRPVAAYLGTLDARFDFDLAEDACRRNPQVQFVFAGTILSEYAGRVATLRSFDNAVCPGRISVEDGRYLLAHCRIGVIPFKAGAMNDAVNPVKMYAYALLGKPVVGSDLSELRNRHPMIFPSADAPSFSRNIGAAIATVDAVTAESLKAFALENTWEARADQAWRTLRAVSEPRSADAPRVRSRPLSLVASGQDA